MKVDEPYVRFLPFFEMSSDFSRDEFWTLPLDWLLGLKIYQKDFFDCIESDGIYYYAKVKAPDGQKLIISFKSAEFKRAFGLYKNVDKSESGGIAYVCATENGKDDKIRCRCNDNIWPVRLHAYGKNYDSEKFEKNIEEINYILENFTKQASVMLDLCNKWAISPELNLLKRKILLENKIEK